MGGLATYAQIEFLPAPAAQAAFAGQPSAIRVTLHNRGADRAQAEFSLRLFQVSSATVMPVGQAQPWKRVDVLGGQTVVESVPVTLPEVRATTSFRLAILAGGKPIAHYAVVACPPDVLRQLASLGGAKRVGIFDPERKLQPVLERAGVPFLDLDLTAIPTAEECALAIFGPFTRRETMPATWRTWADALAQRNVAVLALVPTGTLGGLDLAGSPACLTLRRSGSKASIVACEAGTHEFDGSPGAQLALFRMAELALGLHPLPWENAGRP